MITSSAAPYSAAIVMNFAPKTALGLWAFGYIPHRIMKPLATVSLALWCLSPAIAATATAPTLEVRGGGDCPSAGLVAARLRSLMPRDADFPPTARIEISESTAPRSDTVGDVEVRLIVDNEPAPLALRTVPRTASCAETADAVAIIAASWMARYRVGEPVPLAVAKASSPSEASDAPSPPAVAVSGRRESNATGTLLSFTIGGGAAAASRGTVGPFVTAECGAERRGSGLSLNGVVVAVGERTLSLAPGTAAWRRLDAGVGLAKRFGTPAAFLRIGADVLGGAVFTQGRGFSHDDGSVSFEVGAAASLRAGVRLAAAPVTLWIGGSAFGWPRHQRVWAEGVQAQATLPRLDLVAAVGIAWTPGGIVTETVKL